MNEALMNCPKCGFHQPVDQYCANCGVDMTLVPKKQIPFLKNPAAIVGVGLLAVFVTIVGVRSARNSSSTTSPILSRLARDGSANSARLRAKAAENLQRNLSANDDVTTTTASANSLDDSQTSTASSYVEEEVEPTAAPVATSAVPTKPTPTSAPASASEPGLLVAFAWAEVSHEWLQSMGAADPGVHVVPDLETRLRQTPGSYRIVDSSRQRLVDEKSAPVEISRGDRIALRFDTASTTDAQISGSVRPSVRGADGASRAPATAGVSMDKGQGSIVTFPGVGPSSTGAEIVVFILPRWAPDRNP